MKTFNVISPKHNKTYYLHGKIVTLNNSTKHQVMIYYFASGINKEFAIEKLPEGYEVVINKKSGLPVLKKIKAPQ